MLLAAAPEDPSEARPQGRPGPRPAGGCTRRCAAGGARVAGEAPLEGLELVTQGGHRLVPVSGVLSQRALRDALGESRRRGCKRDSGIRILVQDGADALRRRAPRERQVAVTIW